MAQTAAENSAAPQISPLPSILTKILGSQRG